MYLANHYTQRLQSLSSDLDTSIMKRLNNDTIQNYLADRRFMSIEQKLQLLNTLEEQVSSPLHFMSREGVPIQALS
jgi:hypothetical protein